MSMVTSTSVPNPPTTTTTTSSSPSTLFTTLPLQHPPLLPTDPEYTTREQSFWSLYSRLSPACILRPTSSQEVSLILTTLVRAAQPFAIRSGGHTQWAGANNIAGGVTLDLQFCNWVRYDAATETVDIGPGARWSEVYAQVEKHGRMVAGGRNGKVGVGGLLLGGGKTFFTGTRGFACDDVVGYEVVLGDGRVVEATGGNEFKDLFRGLKGGSGNFGVVTNFRVNAFEHGGIWGGLRIVSKEHTPTALQRLEEFVPRVREEPDSNMLLFLAYMPEQKDVVVIEALIQTEAREGAELYKGLLEIPSVMDMCKPTTIRQLVSEHDPVPNGYYNCFYTLTIKNDLRILTKAADLHDQVVEDLKALVPDGDFLTECLYQPLPKHYGQTSATRGPNMLGLADQPVDGVLWVAVLIVKTPEHEKAAYPMLQQWGNAVKEFALGIENGLLPWVYMNYADKSQQPLEGYGEENVKYIRDVAAKYDPEGVFQKLSPGGFKISDVKS